jgi:hypothetical protein
MDSIYNPNRPKLGWFNAWVGFIWLFLFIHSLKFFISYESFLKRSFRPTLAINGKVETSIDSSEIKIITDKGTFYYYNKDNYKIINETFKNSKQIEVWFDKKDSSVVDFKINGRFLIKNTKLEITVWLIALIFSGGVVILSALLVIQTKGWGAFDLMKKYNKSLFKYLTDDIDLWKNKNKKKVV